MNFKTLVDTCFSMWKDARKHEREPVTLCVLGPPGVGKTAAGRQIAARMTAHVQGRNPNAPPAVMAPGGALDLSSMLPEDLMGLPKTDGPVTRYIPQSWMAPLCEEGAYGVLVLDDLPAAQSQVQVACRQVSLERRIHDMKLSPDILVIVTGNRREDKSAASTLPAHFRNSVCIMAFQPDFKGWEEWYHAQGFGSDIPAFLHFKRGHFSRLPKDADNNGAFATPRSWALLGKVSSGVREEDLPEVAAGLVGDGVASEYAAFRMLRRELVDPQKVLENPQQAIPDLGILSSPDRYIALATGLGEVAARKAKGKAKGKARQDVLTRYLQALAYVTGRKREYVSVSISTFTACKGDMEHLLVAARRGSQDPAIRELIQYLAKTLEARHG
jgi:hypothetical protein